MRVNAFVSGGLLPSSMRGKRLDGLAAVQDWYATFAALGGVSAFDHRAAAAGLPAVEGLDLWPYLSGRTAASPRKEYYCGVTTTHGQSVQTITGDAHVVDVDGVLWKVVTGKQSSNFWQSPNFPNMTGPSQAPVGDCGAGCIFNLSRDPTEQNDLRDAEPQMTKMLRASLAGQRNITFSPNRGQQSALSCLAAGPGAKWNGFWGPFVQLDCEAGQCENGTVALDQ